MEVCAEPTSHACLLLTAALDLKLSSLLTGDAGSFQTRSCCPTELPAMIAPKALPACSCSSPWVKSEVDFCTKLCLDAADLSALSNWAPFEKQGVALLLSTHMLSEYHFYLLNY